MQKQPISICILLAVAIASCKTVPVTGRKQINLVPEAMITAMALTEYDSVVKYSSTLGQYDERAQMVTRIGSNLALALPNSRMQENEADKLGLIFAAMAGYDPDEAIPFWQRMAAANKNKVPQFLSTHPSDETRIKKLSALIPEIKSQYYTIP